MGLRRSSSMASGMTLRSTTTRSSRRSMGLWTRRRVRKPFLRILVGDAGSRNSWLTADGEPYGRRYLLHGMAALKAFISRWQRTAAVLFLFVAFAAAARADYAAFDLVGPKVEVRVQRAEHTLPIAQVP